MQPNVGCTVYIGHVIVCTVRRQRCSVLSERLGTLGESRWALSSYSLKRTESNCSAEGMGGKGGYEDTVWTTSWPCGFWWNYVIFQIILWSYKVYFLFASAFVVYCSFSLFFKQESTFRVLLGTYLWFWGRKKAWSCYCKLYQLWHVQYLSITSTNVSLFWVATFIWEILSSPMSTTFKCYKCL